MIFGGNRRMFEDAIKGFKRELARAILRPLFSFHFIRRRALAMLNQHFTAGNLVLHYALPDHTLYLDPADDVIAARVLLRGDWQRRDLRRAVSLLKTHVPSSEGRVFVDVGANIGTETVYAMLSGHFSSAVSIEPEPGNFALLQKNIAANDLSARVRAVNCAAGARPETSLLVRSASNKGGHAIAAAMGMTGAGDRIAVDVLPLSAILASAGFAARDAGLVWIDVNGTEAAVLEGMTALLEQGVPVVLEHLPGFITPEAARNIHQLLAAHYKFCCRVDDVDHDPVPLDRMDPLRDTGDFLFFR